MDVATSFAAALKQRRKVLDLTQQELAQHVGCATVTIQRIEQGTLRPSRQIVQRLADILDIPADERTRFVDLARKVPMANAYRPHPEPDDARAAPSLRSTLPAAVTSLIGRGREGAAVREALESGKVRLLTITGPGGIGKTRLALQVAGDMEAVFVNGVAFVDLAPIHDPNLVPTAIAHALGLMDMNGQPPIVRLQVALRDQHLLLLLDNFEQVVAAAPVVAELLAAAPRLTILLTSRVVVGMYGEHIFPVPPLVMPDLQDLPPVDQLMRVETVRLFVERAQAVKPDFCLTDVNALAVSDLCHRLEGLPLSIELAAARVRLFAPQALLQHVTQAISGRLRLLSGGPRTVPARQQSLRATLAWSYDLLDPREQRLFRRLAVFSGGCSAEAIAEVCDVDGDLALDALEGLQALCDNHLLQLRESVDGDPRFTMLETIREYAREQLEALGEEARTVRRRHAEYFLATAREAEANFWGRAQARWLRRLNGELDNLRAALAWSRDSGAVETALQLGGALQWFWHNGGHWREGRAWLNSALGLSAPEYRTESRAAALNAAGLCNWCLGDFVAARSQTEESLTICHELGDRRGVGRALHGLGALAAAQGDPASAHALIEEGLSLAKAVGDRPLVGLALHNLGIFAIEGNDEETARSRIEESRRVWQELGSAEGQSLIASSLGDLARSRGKYAEAAAHYHESLELIDEAGLPGWRADYLYSLGHVTHHQGDDRRARALFAEALVLFQRLGDLRGMAEGVAGLAGLVAETQPERTARLLGSATAAVEAMGSRLNPSNQADHEHNLACARSRVGDEAFDAAWAEGQVMPLEQAVAYALEDGVNHDLQTGGDEP